MPYTGAWGIGSETAPLSADLLESPAHSPEFQEQVGTWVRTFDEVVQHRAGALPFRKTQYDSSCPRGICTADPVYNTAKAVRDRFYYIAKKVDVLQVLVLHTTSLNSGFDVAVWMVAHRMDKPLSVEFLRCGPTHGTNLVDVAGCRNLPWRFAFARKAHGASRQLLDFASDWGVFCDFSRRFLRRGLTEAFCSFATVEAVSLDEFSVVALEKPFSLHGAALGDMRELHSGDDDDAGAHGPGPNFLAGGSLCLRQR